MIDGGCSSRSIEGETASQALSKTHDWHAPGTKRARGALALAASLDMGLGTNFPGNPASLRYQIAENNSIQRVVGAAYPNRTDDLLFTRYWELSLKSAT
jgi:hypothetical protein